MSVSLVDLPSSEPVLHVITSLASMSTPSSRPAAAEASRPLTVAEEEDHEPIAQVEYVVCCGFALMECMQLLLESSKGAVDNFLRCTADELTMVCFISCIIIICFECSLFSGTYPCCCAIINDWRY